MGKHPEVYAYLMRDGSWKPSAAADYWRIRRHILAWDEWTAYQEILDSTCQQTKKVDEKVTKLQDSVGDLKDAQSDHAKKQDECLAEVQKVYEYVQAEAKKRNDEKQAKWLKRQLAESYEAGKSSEQEKAALSQKKQKDEDHASELRQLRAEWEAERQEKLKKKTFESQQKAEKEAVEQAVRNHRRLEEDDQERFDKRQKAEEERIRRLAESLWQERHGSDREPAFDRERRPYWYRHAPHRRAPAFRYAEHADTESMSPWMEETIEEEFPMYHPTSRRERRRTMLRGSGPRPDYPWNY
ncbi:hypothetical protein JX265_005542 [Neoarthrinium moseri]|uniref:Uncharacterized protein n=1 Tax=Neoarthrinium moseri TaxID=1658444 RepID=A0A9P9WP71_9PEZI|nr:uncharacterized protein JN550_010270 [Neoarthrinium moseri]KAI1862263.1 hypothetical protein JN550_010270 [Neoarthrinium moseri]KAI1872662.1 hypothetical protein JX265_005542 [Neoarthrinium moseri]